MLGASSGEPGSSRQLATSVCPGGYADLGGQAPATCLVATAAVGGRPCSVSTEASADAAATAATAAIARSQGKTSSDQPAAPEGRGRNQMSLPGKEGHRLPSRTVHHIGALAARLATMRLARHFNLTWNTRRGRGRNMFGVRAPQSSNPLSLSLACIMWQPVYVKLRQQ